MTMILTFFLIWLGISLTSIGIVFISVYIHNNMEGTKIWHFVNKHIVANEDDFIKNE
jgi:hypothetical protein